MLLRLSDRDNVVSPAARRVDDENDNALPKPHCLQAQLAIAIKRILAGDGEARKHHLAADKIKAMLLQIGLSFGFVEGDHRQIVDAL
jgi:hypothetical protein